MENDQAEGDRWGSGLRAEDGSGMEKSFEQRRNAWEGKV